MELEIRHTTEADIARILQIFDAARRFMVSVGNTTQWQNGYPNSSVVRSDMEKGNSYVCCTADGTVVATFCFAPSPDPTYATIYDGHWLNDAPYHVIHRMASDGSVRGVGDVIIAWCRQRDENLRVDTHADNRVMQRLAERNGFVWCGIIHLADGSPRIAYQLRNNE